MLSPCRQLLAHLPREGRALWGRLVYTVVEAYAFEDPITFEGHLLVPDVACSKVAARCLPVRLPAAGVTVADCLLDFCHCTDVWRVLQLSCCVGARAVDRLGQAWRWAASFADHMITATALRFFSLASVI